MTDAATNTSRQTLDHGQHPPLTLLRPLGESVRGQGAGDELDQVAALGAVLAVPRPRHAAARR